MAYYRTQILPSKNKIILADSSERGCYVPMKHVLDATCKVHDGIQIMKTYYPHDEMWSPKGKISAHTAKKNITYAWNYEYEDYDPLDIFEENSDTLSQMSDIKQFGSDIFLTLTLDLSLSDEEIKSIINPLNRFGRVYLRINHECNGNWFRYNIYNTFKETSDFFVRCHRIIKSVSTNIFTVFSISADMFMASGVITDADLHLECGEMIEALSISDYWAIDKYKSLFFGWPFETEVNKKTSFNSSVKDWWSMVGECYIKMIWKNHLCAKPVFITEFNSDSDVDGGDGQAEVISQVYGRLASGDFDWIEGITLYQFRDFGGLGLEKGGQHDYTRMPSLDAYKKAIKKFKHRILTDKNKWARDDFNFTWYNSDDITGLTVKTRPNGRKFTNKFSYPVYIVYGKEQNFVRLGSGEAFDCGTHPEICLAVPPSQSSSGDFIYSHMVRNIRKKIEDCFAD